MKLRYTIAVSALVASTSLAQTQLVRGDVDSIRQTRSFQLKCTTIRLVSRTVNLQQLHDQARRKNIVYEMQVRASGSGNQTTLDVVSASAIPKIMDMGNLRLGRADRWQVRGTPGSLAFVFVTPAAMTRYLPVGPLGTWILGPTFVLLNQGVIRSFGQFQFFFQPPNLPGLVGLSIASQALIRAPSGSLLIANADCKTVRSR